MFKRSALLALLCTLAACVNFKDARVTAEQRELTNRAAVVVLLDEDPRLHRVAQQPTRSTDARLGLPDWHVNAQLRDYLASRVAAKGFKVMPFDYQPTDPTEVYASSVAQPALPLIHGRLVELAAAQQVDLLIVVYRQTERDFVSSSVENLIGYGVVNHEGVGTHAYAAITLEAIETHHGRVVGHADGQQAVALPDDFWQPAFEHDHVRVPLSGAAATTAAKAMMDVLIGAARTAAQQTGLSH